VTDGTLLAVDGVRAAYGRVEALHGVSLEVRPGEIVALIGANGAGKTTTLSVISGLIRPTAGRVLLDGEEIHRRPAHEIVARGVVQVPEGRRIFPRLTVLENLRMGAYLSGDAAEIDRRLGRVLDLFPILRERAGQAGGTLSGGEQQMLAIGRALMSTPRLLLLDEPSLGLAPLVVARIFETLRAIHAEGVTILLVEQNARAALSLADRAYVLETGAVALSGTGRDLVANDAVRKAYLGE
jgi:branched-chain amino acid transport system ATP-binding protein